jgi:hypothetical protein
VVAARTDDLTAVVDGTGVARLFAGKHFELDHVAADPKECVSLIRIRPKKTLAHDLTAIIDAIGGAFRVARKRTEVGDGSELPKGGVRRAGYVSLAHKLTSVVQSHQPRSRAAFRK